MLKNYAQTLLDDLYDEVDRDYHFFTELLGFVESTFPEPYMKNKIDLHKNKNQQCQDALTLANFLISSGAYVGFYMKNYGNIDKIFNAPHEFEEFIKKSAADDINYYERITTDDRYTVGLKKIQPGAKAPTISSDIERIFRK